MNRIDLQAPTLAGPPWTTQEDRTPSCTTPQQMTSNEKVEIFENGQTRLFLLSSSKDWEN